MTAAPTNSIFNESTQIMNNLWQFHEKGLAALQKEREALPTWKQAMLKIIEMGAFALLASIPVLLFVSWAKHTVLPILLGAPAAVLVFVVGAVGYTILANTSFFNMSFKMHCKQVKSEIFGVDTSKKPIELPRVKVLENLVRTFDESIEILEGKKPEDEPYLVRLFADMPKEQTIKALRATTVVLHLLSTISLRQAVRADEEGVRKHITWVKDNLDKSNFSEESKKQLLAVANYLETNRNIFSAYKKLTLEDIDSVYQKTLPQV